MTERVAVALAGDRDHVTTAVMLVGSRDTIVASGIANAREALHKAHSVILSLRRIPGFFTSQTPFRMTTDLRRVP